MVHLKILLYDCDTCVTLDKPVGFAESREWKHRRASSEASSASSNPKHGLVDRRTHLPKKNVPQTLLIS